VTDAEVQAAQDRFVAMCEKLRSIGATKVVAGGYEAEFASTAPVPQQQQPTVLRIPVGLGERVPIEQSKPETEEPFELYPGEKLTAEDKERRRNQREIMKAVTGE